MSVCFWSQHFFTVIVQSVLYQAHTTDFKKSCEACGHMWMVRSSTDLDIPFKKDRIDILESPWPHMVCSTVRRNNPGESFTQVEQVGDDNFHKEECRDKDNLG